MPRRAVFSLLSPFRLCFCRSLRFNGISYEIRSLDLEHFIERTTVDDFRREDGNVYAELPIQNLIEKDTQYLLSLKIDTGEQEIHYYTRILWTDSTNGEQMLPCCGCCFPTAPPR